MPVGYAVGSVTGLAPRERFTLLPTFACRNLGVAAIVAVTSLGRPEFLGFAALFFLTQLPLTLLAVAAFRAGQGQPALAEG